MCNDRVMGAAEVNTYGVYTKDLQTRSPAAFGLRLSRRSQNM